MDDELRALRRKATTKEDTLELIARLHRAGPEALHYGTHAAIEQYPQDEDVRNLFKETHSYASVYVRDEGQGRSLIAHSATEGTYKLAVEPKLKTIPIVDTAEVHLVEDNTTVCSLLSQQRRTINTTGLISTSIQDVLTLPEGTFVLYHARRQRDGFGHGHGTFMGFFPPNSTKKDHWHHSFEDFPSFYNKMYADYDTHYRGWNALAWQKKVIGNATISKFLYHELIKKCNGTLEQGTSADTGSNL